jgi:4-hydroxyphenylpyruvate dioxygenase-like putative hemolysin
MSDFYDDYCVNRAMAERYWDEKEARANFRTEVWTTKDGREIAIKDMEDSHLFNAYKQSQDGLLFREMVLRLFENKLSND